MFASTKIIGLYAKKRYKRYFVLAQLLQVIQGYINNQSRPMVNTWIK